MSDNAVATGDFVAEHLNDGDVQEEQIQPNGVDLTIGEVYRNSGQARFSASGYSKPNRTRIEPRQDGLFRLPRGQYPIVYAEKIEIPEGYVGRVYPRSRLMRCGLHLTSALWDSGYEGYGEGLLRVPASVNPVRFPERYPIAQIVFQSADGPGDYDGSHQNERLARATDGGQHTLEMSEVDQHLGEK
jgi:deoxycytidine triphosphate deaminase